MNVFLKHRRTLLLMAVDLAAGALSCGFIYFVIQLMMGSEASIITIRLKEQNVLYQSTLLVFSILVGMYLCGVYHNMWRYAAVRDFSKCISGFFVGVTMFYMLAILLGVDRVDIFIALSSLLIMCMIVAMRVAYSMLYIRAKNSSEDGRINTMIVGAGTTGNEIISEMNVSANGYKAVIAVDDDLSKLGKKIQNVKVAGTTNDIPELAEKYRIKTIMIAIPSMTKSEKRRILNICSETVCKVKILPYLHELMMNADMLQQTKDVDIEDLLGRDSITLDDEKVSALVKDKVCMVTGGGGSIGSELCRQLASYQPQKLVVVDIYENNAYDIQQELIQKYPELNLDVRIASVRDYDKMKSLFEELNPELVYHAAAHKHVPLMETSPEEAIKNNVAGTFNVASLANFYQVKKFVLVSTDKAVNPTNVMGATKRCCEMIVQYFAQKSTYTEFAAVRFGNVLGSNGSVIPLFERQIASGGPITVTHPEIIRYFMTIPEAVSLILQAGTIARGGEIFVLDMGEPVKILSLAENLIKLHGLRPNVDIKIEFTGLRPGEKLFEELLMAEEGLRETANSKIFIGQQVQIDEQSFVSDIENICRVAASNDSDKTVDALRKLVPTFDHSDKALKK